MRAISMEIGRIDDNMSIYLAVTNLSALIWDRQALLRRMPRTDSKGVWARKLRVLLRREEWRCLAPSTLAASQPLPGQS